MAKIRLRRIAGNVLAWPLRSLARLRPEGLVFLVVVVVCGMLSLGSNTWSNIPLLMALTLLSLWWIGRRLPPSGVHEESSADAPAIALDTRVAGGKNGAPG